MSSPRSRPRALWSACAVCGCAWALLHAPVLAAQHAHGDTLHVEGRSQDSTGRRSVAFGAQATPAVSRVTPAWGGRAMTEWFVSSPVIAAHGSFWRGRLTATAEINLEGALLPRGELTPGVYGEGFVDRRHPHTYVHEAVLTASGEVAGTRGSLSAGRGFAPFGTDDPMSRPLLKFPVNHHLAQILERGLVIAAVARGPVMLEAALFNGDESTRPQDLPNWSRLGDSWAARATVTPMDGAAGHLELQASHAFVRSPEFRDGGGLDQRKWSASARYANDASPHAPYALVEWATTGEYAGAQRAYTFSTALAEGAVNWHGITIAARAERTTRPEEERLRDRFRTARPPAELNLIGITRWTVLSARASAVTRRGPLAAEPFLELARASTRSTVPQAVFDPEMFYGASQLWTTTAGVRITVGRPHSRMGRYGVAVAHAPATADRSQHGGH